MLPGDKVLDQIIKEFTRCYSWNEYNKISLPETFLATAKKLVVNMK